MDNRFNPNGANYYQPAPNRQNPVGGPFPPFTNIILVDSFEQALGMSSRLHSEMAYWDRYQDKIYRIYTDNSGNKQYMILDVKIHRNNDTNDNKEPDYKNDDLIRELVNKVNKLQADMEVLNGKYNVNPDGTDATAKE